MEISEKTKPKHETTSSSSSYIHEWFLHQILFKLPFKSVFRFKCVSKQFLTLISDPSFIQDYISRASSSPSKPIPWTFVSECMLQAQGDQECGEKFAHFERNLLDSTLDSPSISKLVAPCPSMERYCKVEAISNGLCLCSWCDRDDKTSYFIFNPVTKQFVLLPPPNHMQGHAMAFYARVDQVGVVRYKVAHLLMDCGLPTTHLTIEEFSSKTYKWASFTTQFQEPMWPRYFKSCFSFRGIFHWVDDHDGLIISYDPVRMIRCPGNGDDMMIAGGKHTIRCITIADYNDQEHFIRMWRLKDYEQGIWELDHKFALSEVLLPYADNKMLTCNMLFNIALHPELDLLYFWGKAENEEWMLVSFNVRTRKLRVSDTAPRICGYSVALMSFLITPFVLPPWPAILPHPPQ